MVKHAIEEAHHTAKDILDDKTLTNNVHIDTP